MDIYEIYYINKFKPKYNKEYMNKDNFNLRLPELNFKPYEDETPNKFTILRLLKKNKKLLINGDINRF